MAMARPMRAVCTAPLRRALRTPIIPAASFQHARSLASEVRGAPPTGQTVALDWEYFPVPQPKTTLHHAHAHAHTHMHANPSHARPEGTGVVAARNAGVQSVAVAHGLFGSKQNWRSLARRMAQRWGVPIYTIDLRNHGDSPHIDGMNYEDMANDVIRWLKAQELSNVLLVGHSMGGKTVLATALNPALPQDALAGLVSVDMSPARGALSPEFKAYLNAMTAIQDARISSRAQADAMLAKTEPSLAVRQFLLTNLERKPDADCWTFRIPLEILHRHIDELGDFPYAPNDVAPYEGKTLFVKGAKSKYLNRHNIPIANALYPNSTHMTLDTGHWVQAEQPHMFIHALEQFLINNPNQSS